MGNRLKITNTTQPNPIPYGLDKSEANLAQVITVRLRDKFLMWLLGHMRNFFDF